MKRIEAIALVLFFAACYALSFYLFRPAASVSSYSLNQTEVGYRVASTALPAEATTLPGSTSSLKPAQTSDPGVAGAEEPEDSKRSDLKMSVAAVSEPDPDLRGEAIQQLGASNTPDSVHALGQAAMHDKVARNRHLAIESLRSAAANLGDRNGSVRAALRMIMESRDREFAERAHAAYQDVADFSGEIQ